MRTTMSIALLSGACSVALAQHTHDHNQQARQPARPAFAQDGATPGDPLFTLGEDGEPVGLVGPVDLAALDNNPLVTDEDRALIEPLVQVWLADLEATATENIDLLVNLRADILGDLDVNDSPNAMYVNDSVDMLRSTDTLTNFLEDRGGLTHDQAQLNRRIVNDFQRASMMYVGVQSQESNPDDLPAQIAVVTRSNYAEALRDTFWVYDRVLASLAAHPDVVLAVVRDAQIGESWDGDAAEKLLFSLDYPQQKALAERALRLDEAKDMARTPG